MGRTMTFFSGLAPAGPGVLRNWQWEAGEARVPHTCMDMFTRSVRIRPGPQPETSRVLRTKIPAEPDNRETEKRREQETREPPGSETPGGFLTSKQAGPGLLYPSTATATICQCSGRLPSLTVTHNAEGPEYKRFPAFHFGIRTSHLDSR